MADKATNVIDAGKVIAGLMTNEPESETTEQPVEEAENAEEQLEDCQKILTSQKVKEKLAFTGVGLNTPPEILITSITPSIPPLHDVDSEAKFT